MCGSINAIITKICHKIQNLPIFNGPVVVTNDNSCKHYYVLGIFATAKLRLERVQFQSGAVLRDKNNFIKS